MKPVLCLIIASLLFTPNLSAQRKKKDKPEGNIYLFKADWQGASSLDDAAYFMTITKENDSLYICRYYNKYGPMVRQESYADVDLTMPNGRFCWYDANGNLDSTGLVLNTKKDGYWDYLRDGKSYLTITYNAGKLVEKRDNDTKMIYYADGTQISYEKKRIKDSIALLAADTAFTTIQVEAKFQNGDKSWMTYLANNLKTPDRLMNVLNKGTHTVIVCFIVNKEGSTGDIYIVQSKEWSADTEVIRMIKNSPKWQPAQQNGRKVLYRQKQSITFEVN